MLGDIAARVRVECRGLTECRRVDGRAAGRVDGGRDVGAGEEPDSECAQRKKKRAGQYVKRHLMGIARGVAPPLLVLT